MFLASSGLEELFITDLETNPADQYRLAQQVRTLSLPSEMGDRFKVMALYKGFTSELMGFRLADQRHRL
jgi:SAM-dependent MidA family methyltransferase